MKLKLESLQASILRKISDAAQEGKIDEITRLSALATRTKELAVAHGRLEEDVRAISILVSEADENGAAVAKQSVTPHQDVLLSMASARRGRREVSCIEVIIDWSKNGQPYGIETIRTPFASESLVQLIRRLYEVYGQRAVEVASGIQVNRGPMISQNPDRDYANQSNGEKYSFHLIPGTRYSVLTHSSTDQKVNDVQHLLRELSLVPGSYSVKKVTRS